MNNRIYPKLTQEQIVNFVKKHGRNNKNYGEIEHPKLTLIGKIKKILKINLPHFES